MKDKNELITIIIMVLAIIALALNNFVIQSRPLAGFVTLIAFVAYFSYYKKERNSGGLE